MKTERKNDKANRYKQSEVSSQSGKKSDILDVFSVIEVNIKPSTKNDILDTNESSIFGQW